MSSPRPAAASVHRRRSVTHGKVLRPKRLGSSAGGAERERSATHSEVLPGAGRGRGRVQGEVRPATGGVFAEAVPVATAIGVFGVIYGATATTVMGPALTVASSVLLFSGAAQFTMVGLVAAGATPLAVLAGVAVLGLRHLPLAAVVLPRLATTRPRRALLALVLLDETAGLAVASPRPAARTLAVVGATAYAAWVAGTVAGVLGADLLAAAPLASVVFVILFVGLAALCCRSAADVRRALLAAVATGALLVAAPALGALGAIVVAVGVAATARRGRS